MRASLFAILKSRHEFTSAAQQFGSFESLSMKTSNCPTRPASRNDSSIACKRAETCAASSLNIGMTSAVRDDDTPTGNTGAEMEAESAAETLWDCPAPRHKECSPRH